MIDTESAFRALAAHLRGERARADLTQPALAKLTGIHVTTISHIERGHANMSLEQLFKIAAVLGTSAGTFLNAALAQAPGRECSHEEA
jgi:transcriptional regulator with XRE-family HTH domain